MERELSLVMGLYSAWKKCSNGDFIYLPLKSLLLFFEMRYLSLRKVEQTAKIVQQGSDRGSIQN